jgi:pseudouridine-5'-phosphate glycosidase
VIRIAGEVQAALDARAPVVALESTLIAHGLPYPDNREVGLALEEAVRGGGAVPATIAVVDGEVRIGLDLATLERLARDGARFTKAGAADLAVHIAAGANAATTVSATAQLAARAGIRVFATGGIGGVHRGDSGDVSSDVHTLARTPIAVVSAGAKAILDLPRTAEMLDTLGVLVIGFGTDELPAFWSRSSGVKLDHRVDDVDSLARIVHLRLQLGGGGVLVANPIPARDEIDPAVIAAAVAAGERAAAAAGVGGKRLTPFLLAEVARATGGASVVANRALALNNARLAAALAVALTHQRE